MSKAALSVLLVLDSRDPVLELEKTFPDLPWLDHRLTISDRTRSVRGQHRHAINEYIHGGSFATHELAGEL